MTPISDRTRSTLRATVTIVAAALVYEAIARTGYFPPALMPTLPKVWHARKPVKVGTLRTYAALNRQRAEA